MDRLHLFSNGSTIYVIYFPSKQWIGTYISFSLAIYPWRGKLCTVSTTTTQMAAPSLYSSSTSYYCSLLLCTDSDTHAMLTSDRQTHLARSMKKLVISGVGLYSTWLKHESFLVARHLPVPASHQSITQRDTPLHTQTVLNQSCHAGPTRR